MIEKIHPYHKKRARIVMVILAVLTAITYGLGFYFAKKYGGSADSVETQTSIMACLFFGCFLFFSIIARGYFCICASCKAFLFKQVKVNTDSESRKFVCHHCSTIWDNQIIIVFGGN